MPLDLKMIERQLLALRDELDALESTSRDAAKTVVLDQTRVGRLSRMDALQAQAISQESMRRREELRQRIEPALQRLATGEFGHCIDCDEEIPAPRLAYDPTCVLCIACAQEREQS